MKFIEIENKIINLDHIVYISFEKCKFKGYTLSLKFHSRDTTWTTHYKTVETQHKDYDIIVKFLEDPFDKAKIPHLKEYND